MDTPDRPDPGFVPPVFGPRPPPPTPDLARVAAGAPLRATLLAQLDAYERAWPAERPAGSWLLLWPDPRVRERFPALAAYGWWFGTVETCGSLSTGGYHYALVLLYPTPAQLREPWRLDLFVSGTPWCGLAGGDTPPSWC